MSTNATVMVPLTTEGTQSPLLSEELAQRIYRVFHYLLLPCVSVVGIVGNVTSIVILTRQGFKKCSNVLLMALSVSDVLFLMGINNIPMYIYSENMPPGFRFSETINYMLYIFNRAFVFSFSVGLQSTLVIPVLITGERLLAVLSPLKVYYILTPRRVLVAVSCLYILSGASFLYYHIICMQFKQVMIQRIPVGVFLYTDVYVNNVRSGLHDIVNNILNYVTGILPITVVTSGCVVIGVQVALLTHRRQQLTSHRVKPGPNTVSKTTKTLLSICFLYIVCNGFGFLLAYIEEIDTVVQDFALRKVLGCIRDSLLCVNCVGDFVIYVRANNRMKRSIETKH